LEIEQPAERGTREPRRPARGACAPCFGLRRTWGRMFGAASVPRELRDRKKGKELVFNMQNAEIARLLGEVADLLEISAGNPFKVRAYRNAARTVADHPDPLSELVKDEAFDLTDLPGIGGSIAKEITAQIGRAHV